MRVLKLATVASHVLLLMQVLALAILELLLNERLLRFAIHQKCRREGFPTWVYPVELWIV